MNEIEIQKEHERCPANKLALTNRQLQAVMDAIDAPILVVDNDLVVRFANQELGNLWGIDPVSLIGKNKKEAVTNNIKHLFKDPEEFQERLYWLYDHPNETAIDDVIMIKPAERLLSRFSGPILDSHGNHLGRVEVYTDVTSIRSIESRCEQRNQELLAFKKIAIEVGRSLDMREITKSALEALLESLSFDCGFVVCGKGCSDPKGTFVCHGIAPPMCRQLCTKLEDIIHSRIGLPMDEVIILWDEITEQEMVKDPVLEQLQVVVAIPLLSKNELHGRMYLLSETEKPMVREWRETLSPIIWQIGAALENSKLHQRVQQIAILEERERLSRELHDYLAQMLGYIKLNLHLIDEQISNGLSTPVRTSLNRLEEVINETYTSVRESIFNLRATVKLKSGFVPSLQTFLEDYRTYYGVNVQLEVAGDRPITFSPDVDIQLIRIIQEALANIRKHAKATQGFVRIQQSEDEVRVSIEDYGQGFSPELLSERNHRNIGLQVMRERAESIGGTLQIDSRVGEGTRVVVCIKQNPTDESMTGES